MAPTAFIEHQLPGRLRLRVPDRRGDHAYFESVTQSLSAHPGVSRLRTDARRGSVIIHHTDDDAGRLIATAGELFSVFEEQPRLPSAVARQPETAAILEVLAATWAALGFYKLSRRDALGTASENFWSAFRAHQLLNSRTFAIAYASLGVVQLLNLRILGSASSLFYNSFIAWKLAEAAGGKSRIQFPR